MRRLFFLRFVNKSAEKTIFRQFKLATANQRLILTKIFR